MSNLQGTAAVQAFIEGCLATKNKELPISKAFRTRLGEIADQLKQEHENIPVSYYSKKELDDVVALNIFIQEKKQAQQACDFYKYNNDFLKFIFRVDLDSDLEKLFSADFLLDKAFKKYFYFIFYDLIHVDLYELKALRVKPDFNLVGLLNSNFSKEAKKLFKGASDETYHNFFVFLLDVAVYTHSESSLIFFKMALNNELFLYRFYDNEFLLKRLILANHQLYQIYNSTKLIFFFLREKKISEISALILRCVERFYEKNNLTDETKKLVKENFSSIIWHRYKWVQSDIANQMNSKIEVLMQDKDREKGLERVELHWPLYGIRQNDGAPWPRKVADHAETLTPELGLACFEIWCHADNPPTKRGGDKWLETAAKLHHPVREIFDELMIQWLKWIVEAHPNPKRHGFNYFGNNETAIKGLIRFARFSKSTVVAALLVELLLIDCRKDFKTRITVRSISYAVLHGLAAMGVYGISSLSQLHKKIKSRTMQDKISQMIEDEAQRLGMSKDDLGDLSVPTFEGLADGVKLYQIGEYQASLQLKPAKSVELVWSNQGKILATPPQAAKKIEHKEIVTQIKQEQKMLADLLNNQTQRLEDSILQRRTWTYEGWQTQLVGHQILGWLAKRLIWQFEIDGQLQHGFYTDGQWCDVAGQPLQHLTEQTMVRVWHPIFSTAEEVLAWRQILINRQIVQPFKQAFREVYVVTPAEIAADKESRRYAGHYLRQHQLKALCDDRSWNYALQMYRGSGYIPARRLPEWNINATLYLEGSGGCSDAGVFLYVCTNFIHFYRREVVQRDGEEHSIGVILQLDEVPPLVFSEVMRDIDLFVGVCSIGTDATLGQAETDHRGMREYWQNSRFADLTASALVRKDTLDMIISKLAIASQCRFEGKYLQVEGKLRSYKIHLGSGNILMSPNDQYLCIVSDHKKALHALDQMYLPFEGDQMLSLILSKALLLAADDQITDRSIVQQIRHS